MAIRAVLFDYGGVLSTSPFLAFARYEAEAGLPEGFLRTLNATDPHTNAWSRLERAELAPDVFAVAYETEARAAGAEIDGRRVLDCLVGEVVPEMVDAVRRVRAAGFRTGLLTNNFLVGGGSPTGGFARRGVLPPRTPLLPSDLFDVVVESAREGVRKPELRFYELACERLDIAPEEAVFLDDLGVNLKPARVMGMTTIKVVEHAEALDALADAVGLALR